MAVGLEVSKAAPDLPEINDLAAEIARDQAAHLIVSLSTTKKATVRSMVARGIEQGWSDAVLRARIADVVGLDPRSANAVENYRAGLEKQGVAPGRRTRMVTAYAKRLLKRRAQVIAQTELRTALNRAQQVIWRAQQENGDLSRYAVRVFRTHRDEMTCAVCRPKNGRRYSLKDTADLPPLHPNCRCSIEISDQGVLKTDPALVYVPGEEISKGIRRVRTVEGMRYFNLPIGAPIVGGTRVGVVEPERRKVAEERARDVFRSLAEKNVKGDPESSQMQKIAVNKKINHYLTKLAYEHPDDPYAEHIVNQLMSDDFGASMDISERWKKEYEEEIQDEDARYRDMVTAIDTYKADFINYGKIAEDYPEGSTKTFYLDQQKRAASMAERYTATLAEEFPDGPPERKVPDYEGMEFRGFIERRARMDSSELDYDEDDFGSLRDLSNEDFMTTMGVRRQVAFSTRKMIDTWASTSLDHHPDALALQYAVAQMFDIEGWENTLDYLGRRGLGADASPEYIKMERAEWERKILARYEIDKPVFDAYAEAMYQVTQNAFEEAGVEEVTLYRGMQVSLDDMDHDVFTEHGGLVNFNPLTSWANEDGTAEQFATGAGSGTKPVIFQITVPRERVFSSAVTGLGCLNENEFVLLGGDYRVTGKWYDNGTWRNDVKEPEAKKVPASPEISAQYNEISHAMAEHSAISTAMVQNFTTQVVVPFFMETHTHEDFKKVRENWEVAFRGDMPGSIAKMVDEMFDARKKQLDAELADDTIPLDKLTQNELDYFNDTLWNHPKVTAEQKKQLSEMVEKVVYDSVIPGEMVALENWFTENMQADLPSSVNDFFFRVVEARNAHLSQPGVAKPPKPKMKPGGVITGAAAGKPILTDLPDEDFGYLIGEEPEFDPVVHEYGDGTSIKASEDGDEEQNEQFKLWSQKVEESSNTLADLDEMLDDLKLVAEAGVMTIPQASALMNRVDALIAGKKAKAASTGAKKTAKKMPVKAAASKKSAKKVPSKKPSSLKMLQHGIFMNQINNPNMSIADLQQLALSVNMSLESGKIDAVMHQSLMNAIHKRIEELTP